MPCYCTILYFTLTYGSLAIVLPIYCTIHLSEGPCIVLYTYLRGFCIVLYCTIHLPEGALLLSWWLEEEAGSPIFTSCPNCFTPSSVQIWKKKKNQHFIINVDWFSITSTPQTIYTQWNNMTNSTHGYVIPRKSFFMLSDCWNWQSIGIWISFVNKPAIYWPTPWDQ